MQNPWFFLFFMGSAPTLWKGLWKVCITLGKVRLRFPVMSIKARFLQRIGLSGQGRFKLGFIARRRAEQEDSAGAQGRAQGPPKAEPGLPGGGEAITRRAAAAA